MDDLATDPKTFVTAKWEMPKPGPLTARWLSRAEADGTGLRRWQGWIWWMRQKKRRRSLAAAVGLIRGYIEAPFEVWHGLRRFGGKTAQAYGISKARQYRQLLWLRWRSGIRPESYYKFMLFLPDRLPQARNFVEEIGQPLHVVCRHAPRTEDERIFADKGAFREWCLANDLPTVTNFMEIVDGEVESGSAGLPSATDLFVKPANGIRGVGVSRWRCVTAVEGHLYADGQGRELCAAEFEDYLCRLSRDQGRPYLVQPALRNHQALRGYTNGSLATVRLMTVRASGEPTQALMAALRMPTGESVADNFDAGGVAAPISLTTGECGPGIRKKDQYPPDTVQVHPDTGQVITDLTVPFWSDCIDLVCRAHDLIDAQVPVIGWDVAVLEDGPILIEANHLPCENLAQMPAGFPLGASLFARVVCARLRDEFLGST